jgi:hypothetical protein
MGLDWGGTDESLLRGVDNYGKAVRDAVHRIAQYWAPILEDDAKQNAPWTDRTANARQMLYGWTDIIEDAVYLYLSHGVTYGYWLEVKKPTRTVDLVGLELKEAGKYAIVLPTLEKYFNQIMKMVGDVMG